jgi:hypothetical protein
VTVSVADTFVMATEQEARAIFVTYCGLSQEEASNVVTAILEAAEAETLDYVAGAAPVPTNAVDIRALRLRYICQKLGRMVSRREVELTFRLPPGGADTVIRRMQALYPGTVEPQLAALVSRGEVKGIGTAAAGDEGWEIYFPEPAGLEHARQLLDRRRLGDSVRVNRPRQTLRVPRRIVDRAGDEHDPLEVLELQPPRARRAR